MNSMKWNFKKEAYKIRLVTNPCVESMESFFFELPDARIPFLLDSCSRSMGFYTETCGVRYFNDIDDEARMNGDVFDKGYVKFQGHYTKEGIVEELVFEKILLEYCTKTLAEKGEDQKNQEHWEWNRKKEWFYDMTYYEYTISFNLSWKIAMEENIVKLQNKKVV